MDHLMVSTRLSFTGFCQGKRRVEVMIISLGVEALIRMRYLAKKSSIKIVSILRSIKLMCETGMHIGTSSDGPVR